MLKTILSSLLPALMTCHVLGQQAYQTLFESSQGKETPEYSEVIAYFDRLARDFDPIQIREVGMTDAGLPLHLVIVDPWKDFDPSVWHSKGRVVLFVNNGIHPGEPDGIDASMMLVRDLALGKKRLPANTVVALIPVYNIGGHLNRGSFSRVNQNGPEAYGFRANARNYDLNRDFIKADTRNAQSFQEIFHWLQPQIFIDTHVSNGADYQHVMTLISTQHNRLGGPLAPYLEERLEPQLYALMEEAGYPLVPYVNAWNGAPEDGWPQFKDSGRYSSGYAALFGCLSFMPETHMLKPYNDRVMSTYALFESFFEVIERDGELINRLYRQQREWLRSRKEVAINHQLDRGKFKYIDFKGYRSAYKPSEVSGFPRLYYDRNQPFSTQVKFFNTYIAGLTITLPKAYLIPQGWHQVIENLARNGVRMERFEKDTAMEVVVYRLEEFNTVPNAYEGHYLHSDVQHSSQVVRQTFRKGDVIVPTDQPAARYLAEVLEPQGEDSFFAWNFFDTILQAKEGYSAYVFEDLAADYLRDHPALKAQLEEAKEADPGFAQDGSAQLRWVYERSPWKEKEHNRYPVFRLE
ncbi:putative Zinc carboxypeptidase [Lunatimonas lonarensis]|uniref:Putative Zinc carboxypeptidase n=1 Tax=Lunatimonas lonarensis TaxID=1232681 RepID=R7ZY02_9BACT|nr:M14 family metallopeptidase [Lunatimonas lonarensis]EON79031.1 putative Zinc carboxypeptidase [Lunatimonas lonarensis]